MVQPLDFRDFVFRVARRAASEATRVALPVDRLLSRADRRADGPLAAPPVFIVGAPRTGSTLLFQAVTNVLDVSYVSNFIRLFYHSLVLGTVLDERIWAGAPHNAYRSLHARTPGPRGPNEADMFWYRWFPEDSHFVERDVLSEAAGREMRAEMAAAVAAVPRPYVWKNLNNGQRLRALQRVFPEALVLYIRRDPLHTAQSILEGRERLYGDKDRWWSVEPANVDALRALPYPAQIVGQIYHLQKQIETDLALFPDPQHLVVEYEAFCADPERELEEIGGFFRRNGVEVGRRDGADPPRVRSRSELRLSAADRRAFEAEIAALDW